MDALYPGRVFWAVYPGRRGDGKPRPMIVASNRLDILRSGELMAVVCSTDFEEPLDPHIEVFLPDPPRPGYGTKLPRKTVAVCDWTVRLKVQDIKETAGIVPSAVLRSICQLAGIELTSER